MSAPASYSIIEVFENRKRYLDLLLLADEQEDMVDRYLDSGRMFVLDDGGGVRCEAVVVELNAEACELKNLATSPEVQGHGYGRAMVRHVQRLFLERYDTMYVGTGETPGHMRFYQGCGFTYSHRVSNFFIDNYERPIIDGGVRLVDMVYLQCTREILSRPPFETARR